SSNPSPYLSRSGSNVGEVTILVQNRVFDSFASLARTVAYTFPISGKLCSNIDNVTLPTNPVPPMKKIFLPLNISVGDNFITDLLSVPIQDTSRPHRELRPVPRRSPAACRRNSYSWRHRNEYSQAPRRYKPDRQRTRPVRSRISPQRYL